MPGRQAGWLASAGWQAGRLAGWQAFNSLLASPPSYPPQIAIRGKGSIKEGRSRPQPGVKGGAPHAGGDPGDNEELHVLITGRGGVGGRGQANHWYGGSY